MKMFHLYSVTKRNREHRSPHRRDAAPFSMKKMKRFLIAREVAVGSVLLFSSEFIQNVPPKKSSNTPSFFFRVKKDQRFPYLFDVLKGFLLSEITKDFSENVSYAS